MSEQSKPNGSLGLSILEIIAANSKQISTNFSASFFSYQIIFRFLHF